MGQGDWGAPPPGSPLRGRRDRSGERRRRSCAKAMPRRSWLKSTPATRSHDSATQPARATEPAARATADDERRAAAAIPAPKEIATGTEHMVVKRSKNARASSLLVPRALSHAKSGPVVK